MSKYPIEVNPECWDCTNEDCVKSLEQPVNRVGDVISCPRCGTRYQIVAAPHTETITITKMKIQVLT